MNDFIDTQEKYFEVEIEDLEYEDENEEETPPAEEE